MLKLFSIKFKIKILQYPILESNKKWEKDVRRSIETMVFSWSKSIYRYINDKFKIYVNKRIP